MSSHKTQSSEADKRLSFYSWETRHKEGHVTCPRSYSECQTLNLTPGSLTLSLQVFVCSNVSRDFSVLFFSFLSAWNNVWHKDGHSWTTECQEIYQSPSQWSWCFSCGSAGSHVWGLLELRQHSGWYLGLSLGKDSEKPCGLLSSPARFEQRNPSLPLSSPLPHIWPIWMNILNSQATDEVILSCPQMIISQCDFSR